MDSDGWVPLLDTTGEGPVTCDGSTQTEGIYYPSSRTMSKAMATSEAVLTSWTVKKPQSGTYSPGRGNDVMSIIFRGSLFIENYYSNLFHNLYVLYYRLLASAA